MPFFLERFLCPPWLNPVESSFGVCRIPAGAWAGLASCRVFFYFTRLDGSTDLPAPDHQFVDHLLQFDLSETDGAVRHGIRDDQVFPVLYQSTRIQDVRYIPFLSSSLGLKRVIQSGKNNFRVMEGQ